MTLSNDNPLDDCPLDDPQIDALRRAVHLNAFISVLLALLVVGGAVAGATLFYRVVERELAPETVVDNAEQAVRANYSQFRSAIVKELRGQAPEIAEQVSGEMIESTPEVRRWLEKMAARQIDYGLDEATALSADQFRAFLRKNRGTIEQAFERIDDAPEEARRLVLGLDEQLEAQIGVDLQRQARNALELHRALNKKLARLADPAANLEPKEELERRMLRIVRTLQDQRLAELRLSEIGAAQRR